MVIETIQIYVNGHLLDLANRRLFSCVHHVVVLGSTILTMSLSEVNPNALPSCFCIKLCLQSMPIKLHKSSAMLHLKYLRKLCVFTLNFKFWLKLVVFN